MSKRNDSAESGHNSDPVFRAEQVREAFAEMLSVDEDREASNAKFKARADKAKAKLKALGFKMADVMPAWPCDTDDEADSLGILCLYAHKHGIEVPWDNRPCPAPSFLDMAAKGRIVGHG